MSAPRRSLWHHRDFRLIWAGDTVSVFGMQVVGLAIPIMAVQLLQATPFEMGLLAALEMLAFLLISLPAGAWVDRWRKKRVIVFGDLSRAAVLLLLPLAWLLDALAMWQLYAVALVTGAITVFFDVANQSYLPEIVDGDQIAEGNGKLSASQQTAGVLGPAAGAALIRAIGSPVAVAVTSACMAASSLLVSRVKHEEEPKPREGRRPMRSEVAEGLKFVIGHPLLVRITACTGISNFASNVVFALFVLYVLRTLDLAETTLGLIFSVSAVGGLLGAVSASRVARWVGEGRSIPMTAVLIPFAAASTPLANVLPSVPTLLIGGFVASWAVVVYNIVQVSFRQRLCPKPLLGRMNASIRFLVWGPIPLGALTGGILGSALGVVPALWIGVALMGLAALPVVLSPLLSMGDLPRELDALADEPEDRTSRRTRKGPESDKCEARTMTERNVLGGELQECGTDPITGFFRDGCCNTGPQDQGSHTICAVVTADFLEHQRSIGNDLSTALPAYHFPGLQPGDRWCVTALNWARAYADGSAAPVVLASTNQAVLNIVPLKALTEHAVDVPADPGSLAD